MPYRVELTLFIVLASVTFLALLAWLLFDPIRHFLYKHKTIRMYYRVVKRVAYDNDFFLVNNFANLTADFEEYHIDHILLGNKYIYCIRDRYYPGCLAAKEDNPSWIYFRKGKEGYIQNPLAMNRLRLQRLSLMSGIDEKLFINIVLINNDCYFTPFESKSDDTFLSSLADFPKLIEELESRDIDPLDERAIAVAARDFAQLNTNNGKK